MVTELPEITAWELQEESAVHPFGRATDATASTAVGVGAGVGVGVGVGAGAGSIGVGAVGVKEYI